MDERLPTDFGKQLLQTCDPDNQLQPELRAAIERIEGETKLQELIYANIGDEFEFSHDNAAKIFGTMLARKCDVPAIIFSWRVFEIEQVRNAIKLNTELANNPKISSKERVNAGKNVVVVVKHLDRLLNNLTKLAVLAGLINPRKDEPEVKAPKNRPPGT